MGHGFWLAARDRPDPALRQAGLRLRLSHPGQGILHGALARATRGVQERRPAGPGRLRRDHRRQRAHLQTTICCCKRLHEHNLPEEAFQWYLDLRNYGSVPHSGFGLGVERTVSWLCGIEHIRETIAFPRTIKRVYP